ncbi:hypothetical protein [Alishewanella longhuensis]
MTPEQLLKDPFNLKLEQQATKPRSSSGLISSETLDQYYAGGDGDGTGEIDSVDDADLIELEEHTGEKGRERLADLVSACEYLIEHGTRDGKEWGTGGTWETMTAAFARFVSAGQLEEEAKALYDELCQKSGGKYSRTENIQRLVSYARTGKNRRKLTRSHNHRHS